MLRFAPFGVVAAIWLFLCLPLAVGVGVEAPVSWPLWLVTPLLLVGCWDLVQHRHSLARNYPLTHLFRRGFESVRPQIRQYLVESDTDGAPFDREQRSLAYARAKNDKDSVPFGTVRDVGEVRYEWITHSMAPRPGAGVSLSVEIGNEQCSQPYSASVLNVSAMSFGSLSAAAVRALNLGARDGGFAQDTGEGGLSLHHLQHGGDLIWEIGTGYFGCRDAAGAFDAVQFAEKAARKQVKMIEVKLSQGAKPGHGGILPGGKVSPEIALARGIPEAEDCISPPYHSAFSTPRQLLEFIAELRSLAGGKPVGFKLCIGHKWEFLGICKAMVETGIYPDFIVVDGKEGGTGAAPVEFTDHVGMPRRDGLLFVVNALTGTGLRDRIRLGASGKVLSGFDMAVTMAIGADWCNSARGFMFALGCLQSRKCHTNHCPVGVATQDPFRQRALVVEDKARRVANFHRHTVEALADLVGAAGLERPSELRPFHVYRRSSPSGAETLQDTYRWLGPGELLENEVGGEWGREWQRASADQFAPLPPVQ